MTKGCDANGDGGVVVDDAVAVLPTMPDASSSLDVLCAGFVDAYGLHGTPNPDFNEEEPEGEENVKSLNVTIYRNLAYRFRMYASEILVAFLKKTQVVKTEQAVQAGSSQLLGGITVIEKGNE